MDLERKVHVGDTEIGIRGVEMKRKVETSSEWSTTWKTTAQAITFVFEHRDWELYKYGNYIERLFAAKHARSHNQVILYDKGGRKEVGGGQTILLTNYQYFASLYAATMQDDGVEYKQVKKFGGGDIAQPPGQKFATDIMDQTDVVSPR